MEPVSDHPRANGFRPSLDYAEGVLGITQDGTAPNGAGFPVPERKTPSRTQCQNTGGLYVRGTGTDGTVWFPLTCGRWDCPARSCGGLNRAGAALLYAEGVRLAFDRGDRVRFITLTAPGKGMSIADIYAGWNRMLGTLRATGEVREYAGVVELQDRGAPHFHVLATGDFIHYRRLSRLARGTRPGVAGRFGKVAWIEEVEPARSAGEVALAGYFSKDLSAVGSELAGYVTKARAEQMRQMGRGKGSRVRPVRCSNGWYPGRLTAAKSEVVRSWFPETAPVDEVDEWSLYRLEPSTGQMRYVKPLSGDDRPNVALLPSQRPLAA